MPSRDSANVVAAADEAPRDALTVLPLALPHALATRIWGALPCDVRLRCREVCPAWRNALAEPRLWSKVGLTATSGVVARLTPALLRAAAARAGGQLERLSVTYDRELQAALLAVVLGSPCMRLLHIQRGADMFVILYEQLEILMRAASRQCVVEADICAAVHVYPGPMLRNRPPFQTLRLLSLKLFFHLPATHVLALAADLKAHPSLCELSLLDAPLDTFATLDAVVDAALTLRLNKLELVRCGISAASVVALPRLLQGAALRELVIWAQQTVIVRFDVPAATLLADALRSNRTLVSLDLLGIDLLRDTGAAELVFGALVGHASLACIKMWGRAVGGPSVHPLLAELVAANSPQLCELNISQNALGDAGLGPLMDALPRNTHLRELACRSNEMSAAFAHDRLIPALAANTSLQTLDSGDAEADAFIAARTAAAAAAARH